MSNKYLTPKPSNLSKRAISEIAKKVAAILQYNVGGDIEAAVSRAGGKIVYKSLWDIGVDEEIYVERINDFTITLPKHTSTARNRFTIAHELGHYFLHHVLRDDISPEQSMKATRSGNDRAELEANWFAASFLMPEDEFHVAFEEYNGSVLALSEKFGVSLSAADIRAKSLKLTKKNNV